MRLEQLVLFKRFLTWVLTVPTLMKSWSAILANPQQQPVSAHAAVVELHGDTAIVICYETVGQFTLAATNVFVREQAGWKLVHHQSGETQPPQTDLAEPEPTLQ